MEPNIRYVRTSDGVNVAYWTMGEGGVPLFLSSPMLFTHASLELRHPVLRAWYERLAAKRTIVRYDFRGQGLSQRNVGPFNHERMFADYEEVIQSIGPEQLDMAGFYGPGGNFVRYAAAHPDRVRRLVLWSPAFDSRTFTEDRLRTVLSLIESDWELFRETFAHEFLGWTGDLAHEWATYMHAAINQEDAANLFAAIMQDDVRDDLPRIQSPTLVLYEAEARRSVAEEAAFVAAAIPDARLVPLQHRLVPVYESDPGTRAIEDFLADGGEPVARAGPRHAASSGTAVILFADIADSTGLTERLGDAAFRERARELEGALRAAIRDASGTAIEGKLLGDGVLAVFTSAREAIEAARRCAVAGDSCGLALHLGLHAGDVIREEGNVYGGAVNIAARIADASAPGEVLVSQTVRDLARTSAGVAFEDKGERQLKGVSEPVRVFTVCVRE